MCRKEVHETLLVFVNTIKDDFEMPELLLPTNDYESTGAFSERGKRRARSASSSKKKKRRSSSRSKSTKSEKAIRGLQVDDMELGSKRGRSENLSINNGRGKR